MYILGYLEPKKVFRYFEELSRIPRGSGNEEEAAKYIENFAKERNLWVLRDKANNIIIRKPATAGYENSPGVIIQGHIDMVNEKNQDTVHDFENDPIKLIIDGDFIRADGTTLGADNGVAVALGMAVLDSDDLKHPPLEVLFTTDEEVGMFGAMNLDGSLFSGKRMINLDCSPEGVFFAGCAGGMRQAIILNLNRKEINDAYKPYNLKIRGLQGGHSGALIHMELGNSNKLMGRALNKLFDNCDILIGDVTGGAKENAIPREADAVVYVAKSNAVNADHLMREFDAVLKKEYRVSDPDVAVIFEECQDGPVPFDKEGTKKIIQAINVIPYGLLNKSLDIEGLTETSTNLGVVVTKENKVVLTSACRSSVASRKEYMKSIFKHIADLLGAEIAVTNEYPEWEYNPESELRDIVINTYRSLFHKEPELTATHGGLECGLLAQKIPGIDIVAFGPNAYGAHTPEEKLEIASMERTWQLLIKILENLK